MLAQGDWATRRSVPATSRSVRYGLQGSRLLFFRPQGARKKVTLLKRRHWLQTDVAVTRFATKTSSSDAGIWRPSKVPCTGDFFCWADSEALLYSCHCGGVTIRTCHPSIRGTGNLPEILMGSARSGLAQSALQATPLRRRRTCSACAIHACSSAVTFLCSSAIVSYACVSQGVRSL